ncbi:MAG: ABC transporter permease [Candidatus Dactylopiibacterium carminicum]|uniref:ABC transporter permease n=1 Tax=Candidatus Dactylopiibacterium carminicum TaxID=857335 RepID=A0A272ESE8_9RHOO|nr:ABC transporter permease [Candidatus Dactylopiibacterium carminicum]KAF7599034.1 ABC transporter permease [Candidatus Dactylopiibacterium carminicum]PAS93039.1 MAG: ABC transporter permease [Candidatus Dactylopiibacterium carminicum]PAS99048.1 MAG: ABC transporter permease [Candidatus Dactylopiibacterium carminicum]
MSATLPLPSPVAVSAAQPSRSYWAVVWRQLRRDPMALAAGGVLLLIIAAAVFAPWLAPADPYKASMIKRLLPIGSSGFLLGTDELGRDLLTRLMYGGRLSLLMGVVPVLAAFGIGTAIGLFAGYVGGKVNMVIMRVLDVFYAFPSVLLAVAISGALGPGLSNSLIALTLVFVPQVVRVAESVTIQVRQLDYIEAARMSGASAFSIIRVHVLGNVLGPVFVYATGLLSVSMILASGLSFLGLGVKPPEPEWGLMLNTLRSAIYSNPWVAALPGLLIFVTSIAFNLLADSVRSAMDIRR